jgi:feruloyl-CoA synthase
MTDSTIRPVRLWTPQIQWEERDDGAILVWQKDALGPYPARMSDRIAHWAEAAPDRPWMAERDADGAWHGVTYAELAGHVQAIGQGLLDLGLGSERPLLILSGNSVGHALMALGAQHAGIPSACISPAYALASGELGKLTAVRDQITPGAVYAEDVDAFSTALGGVLAGLPVIGRRGSVTLTLEALLATTPGDAVREAHAATGPDTVAKFMFTSGTTGSPKAVITTQRMLCANAEQSTDCFAYLRDEPPVVLDWSPWNHVAGGNKVFNVTLYNGGTLYIDGGRPTREAFGQTLANLREIRPTWYWNVPFGYEMLAEAMEADPALARNFFHDLKVMFYAGAAMGRHTWDKLDGLSKQLHGQRVLLTSGLGSTETAPFAIFNTDPASEAGNVGLPARDLVLKLVPVEDKWEARVKGPNITPGYWRNPELTAEVFDDEGFYCLGDALRFAVPGDPSKGFFFDGRVAENFKMSTGTWVGVGALRAKLIDAMGGLIRDAVILGEGQDALSALLVPFRPAIERLVPGGDALDEAALLAHPTLRGALAERLTAYNAANRGMSLRITRAMLIDQPLSFERGEVTDKGSVNQRAVRNGRPDLAARLNGNGPEVILPKAPEDALHG